MKSRLVSEVDTALSEMIALIELEREALHIGAPSTVAAIDEQIEKSFGRKERAIGALAHHREEHGC